MTLDRILIESNGRAAEAPELLAHHLVKVSSISIEIAGRRYPFDEMAIVGARADVVRHPAGTEAVEHPCSLCGKPMLVDLLKRDLAERTGRPFVCLPCALARWPDMLCGTHTAKGRAVTLREAFERGWLGIGQAGDD